MIATQPVDAGSRNKVNVLVVCRIKIATTCLAGFAMTKYEEGMTGGGDFV